MAPIDPSIGTDQARELFRAELAEVRTDAALQALRTRWIGRNNSWSAAFMEALKTAPADQKKALGKGANDLKKEAEAAIAASTSFLSSLAPLPNVFFCSGVAVLSASMKAAVQL